jgi:hypothetical protein
MKEEFLVMGDKMRETGLFCIALFAFVLSAYNTYVANVSDPKNAAISISRDYFSNEAVVALRNGASQFREQRANGLAHKTSDLLNFNDHQSLLNYIAKLANDGLIDIDYLSNVIKCDLAYADQIEGAWGVSKNIEMDEAKKFREAHLTSEKVCARR